MRIPIFFALVALAVTTPARALSLAFLRVYEADGRLRQLTPEGQFSHVAMRIGGRWLHAHPELGMGVGFTDTLDGFGHEVEIVTNPDVPEPAAWQIAYWLGLDFSPSITWNDHDGTTYCSKFPAEYLGIEPKPAFYLAAAWLDRVGRYGEVGVSPDYLHSVVTNKKGFARDFALESRCARLLTLSSAGTH